MHLYIPLLLVALLAVSLPHATASPSRQHLLGEGADQVVLHLRHTFQELQNHVPGAPVWSREHRPRPEADPAFTIRRVIQEHIVPVRTFPQDFRGVTGWERKDLIVPDVTDRETIVSLAKMTYNAYIEPSRADWYPMEGRWANGSLTPFGWEEDGLRGYAFADEKNTTFVITVKGTSAATLWGGDGATARKDKQQDNLLFSCCCARVDYSWSTVCPCYMKGRMCNQTCLEEHVNLDDSYYLTATSIFFDLAAKFPDATIWFNGHSLGGSVVGLLGLTFGVPTISFEAPGDLLPAKRLHLPLPPGIDWKDIPLWHIGHNADPIFLGTCTGASSSCWYAGFAMESRCHVGRVCMFDVVGRLGWKQDIRNHRIGDVIERVLIPWEGDYPECLPEETECRDCEQWDFVDA